MIGLIDSWDVEYNGNENEARFQLVCDSASELSSLTHYDNIKIRIGSECTDIATGDKYLKSSTAWILQPSANAWENVYTKAQVDSMYNTLYQTMLYYHTVQESNDGTITFYSFAGVVGSLTIYGNGQQNGTPTPDNPIMPEFVGTLDGTDWTIPITNAGQTLPVYLGEVPTVRRVKKLVLTGEETIGSYQSLFYIQLPSDAKKESIAAKCTHYFGTTVTPLDNLCCRQMTTGYWGGQLAALQVHDDSITSSVLMANYLQTQYSAGTPVTIWYVLTSPTEGIVNEPLYKIGDYCDELSLTSATVSIPITDGENTLSIDTDLSPSKIEISGTV